MALVTKFITASGIELPNAYFRVSFYSGDDFTLTATVEVYKDQESRNDENIEPVTTTNVDLIPDMTDEGENPKKQVYEHMKTLPKYENAIDVLEPGQTTA